MLSWKSWVLAPCGFAGRCRRFGETCCLHPIPSALALQVLYKHSIFLLCHFSHWRRREHVSPKRRHRFANPHGAKTQDFHNNMLIIAVRNSDGSKTSISISTQTVSSWETQFDSTVVFPSFWEFAQSSVPFLLLLYHFSALLIFIINHS
jgi:hypothetical protein